MSALISLDRLSLLISTHPATFAAIALSILFLLRKLFDAHTRKSFEKLYGCEKAPDESDRFKYDILGISKAIEFASHLKDQTILSYTDSLFQRYGETYTSNILSQPFVLTCNAKNIKHLLSTGFKDFDISALRKHLFDPITPHGIFTVDGPDWKTNREGLRGRLSNLRQLIDFEFLEEQFQMYLKHVPPHGEKFDVQACNFALFTDLQTFFSLGESSNSLSSTQTVAQRQFVDDLSTIKDCIVRDGFRGPLHHFSSKKEFFRACERAKDYVIERTTQQVRKRRNAVMKIGTEDSFEGTESEEIAVSTDQALSILIANDTMGTTLSAIFFCLSHNGHVTEKLRASIIETIGMEPPTWTQLGSLVYVRWVICEGKSTALRTSL
ncbi:hypothetical protein N7456_001156 [Penicillium angulare]|uniref:Cytochrome P450 n=1 Tax=Penicillium angulare TaxID=116970 RepID=A0A9W9KSJ9_9EURO|nr:hypothetical protein N7456_001156 [Penicillium angulare]